MIYYRITWRSTYWSTIHVNIHTSFAVTITQAANRLDLSTITTTKSNIDISENFRIDVDFAAFMRTNTTTQSDIHMHS